MKDNEEEELEFVILPTSRIRRVMMSSATSISDAETQHLNNGSDRSVTTDGENWDVELLDDYIRTQTQMLTADVVDGGSGNPVVQLSPSVAPLGNDYIGPQSSTELPEPSSSSSSSTKLPEVEARVQKWVNDCSPSIEQLEDSTGETPIAAFQNIDRFIELCKTKLPNWDHQENNSNAIDEESNFETIMTLLNDNHVPEAMMVIIHILCSQNQQRSGAGTALMKSSSQSMMLRILHLAVQPDSGKLLREELDITEIEKILTTLGDIFKPDSAYFAPFSMSPIRHNVFNKNYVILEALEQYVDMSIKLALECRKTIFDIDYENMLQIVVDENLKHNSFLSPEQQCKLAKKAYVFVRKSIYIRCHNFLKVKGFNFDILDCSQEFPSSMEHNTPEALNSQEVTDNFGSQSETPVLHPEILNRLNNGLEEMIRNAREGSNQANDVEIARALYGDDDDHQIFYDGNSQALPGDIFENEGYLSSPSYSLSIPRMSKSPNSSDEEQSQDPMSGDHESIFLNLHRREFDSSSSDSFGGLHAAAKRNRRDS